MPHFFKMLTPLPSKTKEQTYYLDEVLPLFTTARRKTFDRWLEGKTLTLINDRAVITKDQLDAFFEALIV